MKDLEGIEITLSAEYKRFSRLESLESRDVEQNRSKTAARLRTRLLGLIGTVKREDALPNYSLDC